jgi:hypothetical protein
MPLDPDLVGRTFTAAEPYQVSREKIREFSAAIQDGDSDPATAPLTFAMVVAFALMGDLMRDPSVGIELRNVVHRDERIEQTRPIDAGDRLVGTLRVDSLRSAAGVDLIGTSTAIATEDGDPVCTAFATLVHRSAS